jgi:UDP-GlcNAc:undecaprenyl-phosphate/decaprenyl-phosphate GlcNAc-1-phosphate transferase
MNNSVFFIASFFFCLAVLLVFDSIWLLLKTPVVFLFKDKPGTRKIHQRAIPRAGGICIAITFCAMICLWNFFSFAGFPRLSPLFLDVCLVITIGIFLVGFFDDTTSFAIRNKAKFLLEFLIAAEVVLLFGIKFTEINFFGIIIIKDTILLDAFSIFWMVGVANAFNIIDGIDGLAGTFAFISFVTVAVLAMHVQVVDVAILCVIIAGCIVGFLMHNVPPARVFLGDTGSLFLGMLLSLFLMYMVSQSKETFSIITAFLIAGFPILDVAVAIGRRFFREMLSGRGWIRSIRAITVADSEHTHHRLIYRGLNHMQATLIIATLSATLCVTAIYINLFEEFKYALVVYMLVVVFWFLYELNFFDRFIVYIRFILHQKIRKQPFKVGVVDADPILHHALIRFKQKKFSFDFISHQELESRDAIRQLRLQAVANANEQFFITATWARDTRKYSREMINSVIKDWTKNASQETAQSGNVSVKKKSVSVQPAQNNRPHTAILINCRDKAEFGPKLALGQQLLEEIQCTIIMVSDQLPDAVTLPRHQQNEIIFIKRPFYVPVFFKELYMLARHRENRKPTGLFLENAVIMKKIAG